MDDRRMRKQEEFIAKARAIHGDKYDYSLVQYRTCKDKVKIVCPIHGVFEQTPDHHINAKNGCLKCRPAKVKATVRARYGVDYVSQSAGFQARVEETNLRKYGVRRPMQSEEIKQKAVESSREHWGTDYPMQNVGVAEKYKQAFLGKYGVTGPLASEEILKRAQETTMLRHGVRNPMQASSIRQKAEDTCMDRYGVNNPARLPDFSERCQASSMAHWGVSHPMQDKSVRDKQFAARIANGTTNSSACEDMMYALLCDRFGHDDVVREYVSDAYPFHCDMYVKSLDLYIELNGTWSHGGHWFDSQCQADLDKLAAWQAMAAAGSKNYRNAVHTWTVRDVMKRDTAIAGGLNYLVFWDTDLRDFKQWLDAFDGNPILKRF